MPKYETLADWTPARIDTEGLEVFRTNVQGRMRANNAAYDAAVKEHAIGVQVETRVWGERHAVVKYLKAKKIPRPPDLNAERARLETRYRNYLTRRENIRREQERTAAEAQKRREYRQAHRDRLKLARTILTNLGYTPGVDYAPGRAIGFLKSVRGQAKAVPQLTDGKG